MNPLIKNLENLEQLNTIKANYKDNSPIYIHGLSEGIKAHLILSLFARLEKNLVVIAEDEKRANEYLNSINNIEQIANIYPSYDINFYNIKSIDEDKSSARMEVLIKQINKEKFITITTLDALRNKLSPLDKFNNSFVKITGEDVVDIESLIQTLTSLNYNATSLVENKGEFAKRGSIIDFWPSEYEHPIRLELFDDEVDSIRIFDQVNQRTIEKINEVNISPISELIYDKDDIDKVVDSINKDIDKINKNPIESNDQKLIDKYKQIVTFMQDRVFVANWDLVNAYRNDNYGDFTDYISEDTVFIFDDISRIYENEIEFENTFLEDVTYQRDRGEVFNSFNNLLIKANIIYEKLENFPIINLTSILKRSKLFNPKLLLELKSLEAENFNKNIAEFIKNIASLDNRQKVFILTGNEDNKNKLLESFVQNDINYVSDTGNERITISSDYSKEGYYISSNNLYVFTQKEIYGASKSKKKRKAKNKLSSTDIINYSDLDIGDYVVHENNGIGVYSGLEKIEVNNIQKDFIVINYKGNDKVYVPIDQMNLVSKYIGNKGEKPKLSSLGSPTWAKAKQRARKAVDEIADDLVKLYAKRSKEVGHAFAPDTPWQNEFEESFPYEETYSQLRSIAEIKADMEKDKPMDRLLTGDVGYGKTEVALRAAFKAIVDGYQVAFLVPTTILASQHFETMKERFKNFPIEARLLSRFNTKKEQDETIKDLKSGKVDIVVGTHRILSKDIKFKKLGLLIIDEEQRFGVKHKEKLKQLKTSLDVLTLSATPIPRTLQMSLAGIRDLSTLDEPPSERLPVNTYVIEYDENIIKSAIDRELSRNGQVYFVYNRVHNIDLLYNHITELIPEARVAIIHGKLTPKQIETIMEDFINGEIDILLSTTIIETGMDISNVNTIVIYDADMMGLSQLYQLKGRIGRGTRSSYAYFTYRRGKVLSEISEKRLKSIRDFSDFGSGYKIAMKDLELRGAGNLLGESQSGHVEAVGYDLYVKFLQEAVEKASGKEVDIKKKSDVYIDIKVDAYIPSSYISDQSQKIEMYTRISNIESKEDYNQLVEDLIDVYGDIPVMVDNIMYVSLIKRLAEVIGFKEIREQKGYINIRFNDRNFFSIDELKEISESYKGEMKLDLSSNPAFRIPNTSTKLIDTYDLLEIIYRIRSKNEKNK
ncbi:transcription-repair coupling factor [uncultured Anaerococcus sp.]|uniref:transcription-repair coupling factor n=1 Tax=uncultured Anaerococcus sp. TaxID=293428 RepID=UPI002638C4F2|nr:transcription-repair coupling factor [uncultured Anaerococcus sp.]